RDESRSRADLPRVFASFHERQNGTDHVAKFRTARSRGLRRLDANSVEHRAGPNFALHPALAAVRAGAFANGFSRTPRSVERCSDSRHCIFGGGPIRLAELCRQCPKLDTLSGLSVRLTSRGAMPPHLFATFHADQRRQIAGVTGRPPL